VKQWHSSTELAGRHVSENNFLEKENFDEREEEEEGGGVAAGLAQVERSWSWQRGDFVGAGQRYELRQFGLEWIASFNF
jgi:hypothetical protein